MVYGKTRLKPAEMSFFNDISIEPSFLENLHAKCYLNEKEALLTSMNLYEFSQINNDEMGILVSREQDPDLYKKIREESIRLVEASENGKESAVAARTRKESPRQSCRRRRRASVSGARPTCRPTQLSRTVAVATRSGIGARTGILRRSTATPAETNMRRLCSDHCVLTATEKYKNVLEFVARLVLD